MAGPADHKVIHTDCSGLVRTRCAHVSKYLCQHDTGIPAVISTARFRTCCNPPIHNGDKIEYLGTVFTVHQVQTFLGADRIIADTVSAMLDPCRSEVLELHRYSGSTSQYIRDIPAVLHHTNSGSVVTQDSRQWIVGLRVYLNEEDARDLDHLCVLKGREEYKVKQVHDLGRMGGLPYATVEISNWRLGS